MHYCVRLLSAKDLYDIAVNATKDHCHSPAGALGTRGYLLQEKVNRPVDGSDAGADCLGDVMAFEDKPLCAIMVACNRNLCGDVLTL